jgi:hypothetical protein
MLRDSLASDMQFVAHPRFALILVVLAFALLWEHNDPKKPAKSILDQPDQPKKNYSAIEAAAMPFFLAFVCGVGLAAFEPSRPDHGLTPPAANNRPRTMQRQLQSNAEASEVHFPDFSGGQPAGANETEPLVRSLPPLTPALDQENEGANIVGSEGLVTVNLSDLRARVVSSSHEGEHAVRRSGQSTSKVDTPQGESLDSIDQAYRDENWKLVATLCEGAIAHNPQSLTPYLLAGEAYANLGKVGRAIDRLEYVKKNGPGNPGYRGAVQQATLLRESIRRLYGQ